MITVLPVLLLGLFASPGTMHAGVTTAACTPSCVCPRSPTTMQEEVDKAHAVFEGISVEERWSSLGYADYTFVVEHSWKGDVRDTVTVRSHTRGTCGARFLPGERVLVFAGAGTSGLHVGLCAYRLLSDQIPKARRSMQRPSWSAKPVGERPLDAWVRATLEQPHAQQPGVRVFGTVRTSAREWQPLAGVHLEVVGTDLHATSDSTGRYLLPEVQPGWYRVRMRLPSGHVEDQYMWVRCRSQVPGEGAPCDSALRDFIPSMSPDQPGR